MSLSKETEATFMGPIDWVIVHFLTSTLLVLILAVIWFLGFVFLA